MAAGKISRIVNSYGSKWGHVRPNGEPRQVFFNVDSLIDASEFATLAEGDAVEFDQEVDRANGMRAIRLRRLAGVSSTASAPTEQSSPS